MPEIMLKIEANSGGWGAKTKKAGGGPPKAVTLAGGPGLKPRPKSEAEGSRTDIEVELSRLMQHRFFGTVLPPEISGRRFLNACVSHFAGENWHPERMLGWLNRHALWLRRFEPEAIVYIELACPTPMQPCELAAALNVTAEEVKGARLKRLVPNADRI